MLSNNWIEILLYFIAVLAITPILGHYMAAIFSGKRTFMHPVLGWLEELSYRMASVDPKEEMTWKHYLKALIWFNLWGFLAVFLLHMFQEHLPLNPQNFPATSWPLAFNTSMSFTTNTNWQSYAGETTLSYLTQMMGLTVQNFVSAATGTAVAMALIRGVIANSSSTIGNFWADMVRAVVYLYLPASVLLALLLVGEGTIQNFNSYTDVQTLEGVKQTIPGGPAASQIAIKQIGTNGGGFFNANSAHPYENPSALSNWLQMIAIIAIPAATTYTYGLMTRQRRHGWILLAAMFFLLSGGLALSFYSQHLTAPALGQSPILEGIETRLGTTNSLLWAAATTGTSSGSVNTMISSLTPLSGGVSLLNIMLGELIFGGVGVGLCSIIMFSLLTVFLSGLMVGRTPEYMGKKIEKLEMKWIVVSVLMPGALILIGSGISAVNAEALSSIANQGPHGLSEILYAFSSAAGNNGSAFAGLNANTNYYNINLGIVMLIGRLAIIIPSLGIAGLLVHKRPSPPSLGTFSTNSFLFFVLLISVIIIVGALTFFPALALGPFVEHLLMLEGQSF